MGRRVYRGKGTTVKEGARVGRRVTEFSAIIFSLDDLNRGSGGGCHLFLYLFSEKARYN